MSKSPEAMKVWREAMSAHGLKIWSQGKMSPDAEPAAASVIEAALQKARDEEREAVVAWLRKRFEETGFDFEYAAFPEAADAFERGEHRREW